MEKGLIKVNFFFLNIDLFKFDIMNEISVGMKHLIELTHLQSFYIFSKKILCFR